MCDEIQVNHEPDKRTKYMILNIKEFLLKIAVKIKVAILNYKHERKIPRLVIANKNIMLANLIVLSDWAIEFIIRFERKCKKICHDLEV